MKLQELRQLYEASKDDLDDLEDIEELENAEPPANDHLERHIARPREIIGADLSFGEQRTFFKIECDKCGSLLMSSEPTGSAIMILECPVCEARSK